jgi:hypothetical protein
MLIFFSLSHISHSFRSFFLSFFLSFIHYIYFFFFLLVRPSPWKSRTSPNFFSFIIIFLKYSPLNSKTAPYLPPPPCLDVARPRAKRRKIR